jgi:SAM-dependent methyltransferase
MLFRKLTNIYKTLRIMRESLGMLVDVPKVINIDQIINLFESNKLGLKDSKSLDLGCGDMPRNPFLADSVYGLDLFEDINKNIGAFDLASSAIPNQENTFDFITAFDFIEHVPRIIYNPERRLPFIQLMNEIYRTLKPNGIFLSYTPIYPYAATYFDPTHVNFITCDTFPTCFDDKNRWAEKYGFNGYFKIISQSLLEPRLITIMSKSHQSN